MDGVSCALGLEKGVEGGGVGLGGEGGAFGGDQSHDAGPALGRADDAAQAGAAGAAEGGGHGLVGGDHEVGDEVGGAVLGDSLDGLNFAVDDDGIGFDTVEVKRTHGEALLVQELGGRILQAQLRGEGGVGVEAGFGAAVGAWFGFEPGAGGGVGKLGMVTDERGVDGGVGRGAGRIDDELDDDGGAVLILVKAGEVGRKREREHREVVDGGVDGLGLRGGGEIERRAFGDGGGDVGNGDENADAVRLGCRRGVLRVFDLIEIAGGVVVDGRPEEGTKVFESGVDPADVLADRLKLGGAFGGVGGVGGKDVEAFADHFGAGGSGKVEVACGDGRRGYVRSVHAALRVASAGATCADVRSGWRFGGNVQCPMPYAGSEAGLRWWMQAFVRAVALSGAHTFSKPVVGEVRLLAGLGVEGDVHAGVKVRHRYQVRKNPEAANLCQVHLLHEELFAELAARGIAVSAGEMGENVTTLGIDLLALPVGARLRLGAEAEVEITGLRQPCSLMNKLRPGLMQACLARDAAGGVVRKAGVMGIVLCGGAVRAGDKIEVSLPAGPLRALGPV